MGLYINVPTVLTFRQMRYFSVEVKKKARLLRIRRRAECWVSAPHSTRKRVNGEGGTWTPSAAGTILPKTSFQNTFYSPAHSNVLIARPLACMVSAFLREVDLNGKSLSDIRPRSTNRRSLGEVSSIWNGFRKAEFAEHIRGKEDATL